MDKRRTKVVESRTARGSARGVSPPASRTRSKSPARVENSGRDSAAIKRGRPKKTDTPSEESSSQSSTPKKEFKKVPKKTPTIVLDDSGDNEEVANINTRSTRLASLRKRLTPVNYKNTPTPYDENKRSASRSVSSMTKEDSQDSSEEVEITPPPSDASSLGIFSKPLVVFWLLEAMLLVPIITQFCFKAPWKWAKVTADLRTAATYCNTQSGSFYLAFLTSTILLSFAPTGRIVKLPGSDKSLKFNGLFTAIVIVGFLIGLELRGLDSLTAIYNNIDRFLFMSIFTALVKSTILYVRAKRSPPANPNPIASGSFVVDFAAGLEINPKIYNRLDIKSISYHRSVIMILIINIALLFKNVTVPAVESSSGAPIGEFIKESFNNLVFVVRNSEYNSASLIVSGLLVLYALDLLIFEHHLATSFQLNSEGCGAELFLRFATFPFLLSLLPRFLLAQKLNVNCYLLAAIAVVFILGLAIKRCSNCLKYEYRLRPADAKFKGEPIKPTLNVFILTHLHF